MRGHLRKGLRELLHPKAFGVKRSKVVSSAQRQDDLFTFQFREKPREARRQRRSASAFDERFLQFHQSQDRQRNVVFIDENDSLKKV